MLPSHTLSTDPRAGIVRRHHMIYTHVAKELRNPATSPLDLLIQAEKRKLGGS